MHQPNLSEIQGELLALRCYVAAIAAVLPAACQCCIAPAFDRHAELVRYQLGPDADARLERTATAMLMRQTAPARSVASHEGEDLDE